MFYTAFEKCLQQAVIDPQQGLRSTDPLKQIYGDEASFLTEIIKAVRENRAEVMLAAELGTPEVRVWAEQAISKSHHNVIFVITCTPRARQYDWKVEITNSSGIGTRPRRLRGRLSEDLWILLNPLLRDVITWLSAGPLTTEEAKGAEFFFGPLRAGNPRYTTQSSTWWTTHIASLLEALLHSEDVFAQYEGRISQTTGQSSRARPGDSSQRAPGSRKSKGWQNEVNWNSLTTIPEIMANGREQHADAAICPGDHSVVDGVHLVHTPELCKLCRQNHNRNVWASKEDERARGRRRAPALQTSFLPKEQIRARSAPPASGHGRGAHTSPAAQVYPGQHRGTPRKPSQTRRGSTTLSPETVRHAPFSSNRRSSV